MRQGPSRGYYRGRGPASEGLNHGLAHCYLNQATTPKWQRIYFFVTRRPQANGGRRRGHGAKEVLSRGSSPERRFGAPAVILFSGDICAAAMDWREPAINVLAGGMSGMCVDSVLYPLDTIKTRLQARTDAAAGKAVQSTSKQQSFTAFYRGKCEASIHTFFFSSSVNSRCVSVGVSRICRLAIPCAQLPRADLARRPRIRNGGLVPQRGDILDRVQGCIVSAAALRGGY